MNEHPQMLKKKEKAPVFSQNQFTPIKTCDVFRPLPKSFSLMSFKSKN